MDRVDFSTVFMTDEESDVQLRLISEENGQKLTFPAHGFVLRRASAVFKSMLDNSVVEDDEEGENPVLELQVKGKISTAFALARYFYTKKLKNLTVDDYIALIKTADLYQITDLFVLCEKQLNYRLTPGCVCQVYETLKQTASKNFIVLCLQYISTTAFLIFTDNYHAILEEATMKVLLKSDALNILDEDQVLEALVSWGQAKRALNNMCNVEKVDEIVADLLPLVRWQFVTKGDKFPRLYELAKERKWLEANSSLREWKIVENIFLLSQVLDLSKVGRVQEIAHFRAPGSYDIFLFTTDNNICLIGLTLEIIRLKKTLWNQDLQLFCNKENLTEMVRSAKVRKYGFVVKSGLLSNEIYIYRVEIKLVKPILLSKCHLNRIEAKILTGHDIAFPEFSLKSLKYPVVSTNEDTHFSFHSKILSVNKIFYFNTS